MNPTTESVLDGLCAGTATNEDVYRALGWTVRPHGRMGVARMDRGRCSAIGPVVDNAGDALYLIDRQHREEAAREAMALNRPVTPGGSCPVARRICIIALMRPDLRPRYQRLSGWTLVAGSCAFGIRWRRRAAA
mgnify:CR=1 FL=1